MLDALVDFGSIAVIALAMLRWIARRLCGSAAVRKGGPEWEAETFWP